MKHTYPYFLDPLVPYHRNSIPVYVNTNRIEFFYQYKKPDEELYIGEIDTSNLELMPVSYIMSRINYYFLRKQYLDESVPDDITKRLLPKICWLTDSLFKTGFEHPIAVHYNPRIQKNVIHPGSIRGVVIRLFQNNSNVKCLYFNTGGVKFDYVDSLQVFTKEELLKHKDNIEIELVADHGSIIPHINLDVTSVKKNVSKWHDFVYRRLTSPSFSIFCNKDIEILKPWYASKEDAKIEIDIHSNTENWDDIVCKCVVLSILGKSYESEAFSITHKLLFDTPK
jgi:hypothetical protein